MPKQVEAPSGTTIATARGWIGLAVSKNGDAVALGGDATNVPPVGVVTDATLVDVNGTDTVLLTCATHGERVKLTFGAAVDVSAVQEVSFNADGEGVGAQSGDYVLGYIADTTAGDIADGDAREIEITYNPLTKKA